MNEQQLKKLIDDTVQEALAPVEASFAEAKKTLEKLGPVVDGLEVRQKVAQFSEQHPESTRYGVSILDPQSLVLNERAERIAAERRIDFSEALQVAMQEPDEGKTGPSMDQLEQDKAAREAQTAEFMRAANITSGSKLQLALLEQAAEIETQHKAAWPDALKSALKAFNHFSKAMK